MSFEGWLRQPTTITGIGALVGTLAGAVAHVLTGDATVSAGAGTVAFAAVHLVIDDNTVAGDVAQLARDALSTPTPATLVRDALKVAADAARDAKVVS